MCCGCGLAIVAMVFLLRIVRWQFNSVRLEQKQGGLSGREDAHVQLLALVDVVNQRHLLEQARLGSPPIRLGMHRPFVSLPPTFPPLLRPLPDEAKYDDDLIRELRDGEDGEGEDEDLGPGVVGQEVAVAYGEGAAKGVSTVFRVVITELGCVRMRERSSVRSLTIVRRSKWHRCRANPRALNTPETGNQQ